MSKLRSLAGFALALLLAGSALLPACKSTGDDKYDETRKWSADASTTAGVGAERRLQESHQYYQTGKAIRGRYAQQV
jgi:hypothetical protein